MSKRGPEGEHTSSSARVNMCFSTTTLSHFEAVSLMADGSSSSQSASLLEMVSSTALPGLNLTYLFNFCVLRIIFFLSLFVVV